MSETPNVTPEVVKDPTPDVSGEPEARRSPRTLRIWIGAGVAILALGLWLVTLVPGWLARDPTQTPPPGSPEAASARAIQATLFYVSEDGSELVATSRDVPYAATPAEQARQIVAAQLQTPAGFVSAIPAGTLVRGVFLGSKGEAYVDLSAQIRQMPVAGSLDEALAVFAIVNAVTVNLHDVTSVQILVDGKEVDSLAGHIDLREPIVRSDAWVRKGQ